MKQFLIFSILICFVAAKYLSIHDKTKYKGRVKIAMANCAKELNVDGKKYVQDIDFDAYENPTEETTCMLACGTRKWLTDEVTLANNKETLYNGLKKIIEEAYKAGFKSSKFTRRDMVNKVENCYASAQRECDFFKCTNFYKSQLLNLFIYNYKRSRNGSDA